MEFTLTYRGGLASDGSVKQKHKLRKQFHTQLKVLWSQPPLHDRQDLLKDFSGDPLKQGSINLIFPVGAFHFAPLVSSRIKLSASLRITLLRPGAPGQLVGSGGDIDNRIKTLFDALSKPPHANQIPPGEQPTDDEKPFFCVLEDDGLVTSLSVSTDRLLDAGSSPNEVLMLVHVQITPTVLIYANIGL